LFFFWEIIIEGEKTVLLIKLNAQSMPTTSGKCKKNLLSLVLDIYFVKWVCFIYLFGFKIFFVISQTYLMLVLYFIKVHCSPFICLVKLWTITFFL